MDDVHVEYMALEELLKRQHPSNPKDHSIDSIVRSIERFGYVTPGTIDERTGYFAEGHGRTKALAWMKQQNREPPARIEKRTDDWYVPVYRGVSFNSDSELKAFLVAANRLTILGGWNEPELAGLLQDLAAQDTALLEATGYDADDLDALLRDLGMIAGADDADPVFVPEQYQVVISCDNEQAQAELLERLTDEGFTCRALIS